MPSGSDADYIARLEKKHLFGREFIRSEEKKDEIHRLFIYIVRTMVVVVGVVFVVRMLHFILPKDCCWLSDEQLKAIDNFVAHGAVGGILVGSTKQILSSHIPKKTDEE